MAAYGTSRARLAAVAENSARWCRVGFRIQIEGSGEALLPDALMFGIPFIEPPWVSVGADMAGMTPWQLSRAETADQITRTPYTAGALPAVSVVVTEWVTESDGRFVIGAKVATYADGGSITGRQPVTAHVLFQGEAMKGYPMPDSV